MTKICGNCKHFNGVAYCLYRKGGTWGGHIGCGDFADKDKLTNGDKIIAGGIKALVKFHLLGTCDTCTYYNKEHTSHNDICLCPPDKTCADGIEAWLNAPAESEGKDES